MSLARSICFGIMWKLNRDRDTHGTGKKAEVDMMQMATSTEMV
jgi:hypothetical protein